MYENVWRERGIASNLPSLIPRCEPTCFNLPPTGYGPPKKEFQLKKNLPQKIYAESTRRGRGRLGRVRCSVRPRMLRSCLELSRGPCRTPQRPHRREHPSFLLPASAIRRRPSRRSCHGVTEGRRPSSPGPCCRCNACSSYNDLGSAFDAGLELFMRTAMLTNAQRMPGKNTVLSIMLSGVPREPGVRRRIGEDFALDWVRDGPTLTRTRVLNARPVVITGWTAFGSGADDLVSAWG